LIDGKAPDALHGLPSPDAVFIGGGLSHTSIDRCLEMLKSSGRLVANAVTLEGESLLAEAHSRLGGELVRLATQEAVAIGGFRGWRPAMPVTQWSLAKGGDA
jgi:precorrin-6B C5,15-methyltransferase / cobalt-precorrin-6B C5,C15-methyltransferase